MFKVIVMPSAAEVLLPAGSSLTELEFELRDGGGIPFGCKAGACGACVIEVLDGLPNLGGRSENESSFLDALGFPGEEFRLACQCQLNGTVKLRVAE